VTIVKLTKPRKKEKKEKEREIKWRTRENNRERCWMIKQRPRQPNP
jgi:hypothetical protein